LVEEGDVNMDWRLSYSEYKEILQDGYIPSSQGSLSPPPPEIFRVQGDTSGRIYFFFSR